MIRINLLSDREAIRKETSRQQVSIFILSICLLVVILGGVHFTQYQKKKGLEQDIVAANQALKELKAKVGEVEKYKKAKKELQTKLEVIEQLQKGKMWAVLLMDNIGALIPEKMWLDKLGMRGPQLTMEGYAIDNETIAQFMKALEQSPVFSNVELAQTVKQEVEGVGLKQFSMTAVSDPAKAEQAALEAGGETAGKKPGN